MKILKLLIRNTFVAIALSACINIIFLCLAGNFGIYWMGPIWSDKILEGESKSILINWLTIAGVTIFPLFLCFLVGRKILRRSENMFINIFSILALMIIHILGALRLYGEKTWLPVVLTPPLSPLAETIAYFSPIEIEPAYLIVSILPSLTMWAGLRRASYQDKFSD